MKSIEKKSQKNFMEEESFGEPLYQYTEPGEMTQSGLNQEELSNDSSSSFDDTAGNRVESTIANLRNRRKEVLNKQKNEVRSQNPLIASNKSKISSIE